MNDDHVCEGLLSLSAASLPEGALSTPTRARWNVDKVNCCASTPNQEGRLLNSDVKIIIGDETIKPAARGLRQLGLT